MGTLSHGCGKVKKVLAIECLPRQEELVNYVLESGLKDRNYITNLFINLSPYVRKDKDWKEKMAKRRPVVEVKKKSERQMKIEALQQEITKNKQQLDSLKKGEESLKSYEIVGMLVTHKKYGDGLVCECDGARITVEFDVGEKLFHIPKAFEEGHLISEYPDFLENIKQKYEINDQIETIINAIEEKKEQLATLII